MDWLELRILTTHEAAEAVSEILMSLGAGGTQIDDPADLLLFQEDNSNWDYIDEKLLNPEDMRVKITAYYPENVSGVELAATVREKLQAASEFLDVGDATVTLNTVHEEDWANAWKQYYKPFHITPRVVIKPTWEEYRQDADASGASAEAAGGTIVIEMDPGMAFGTGTHETTRLCAGFIEEYVKQGDEALDVGCGTGILSMIAVKLGAASAKAIDIDSVAVKVTNQNSDINGTSGRVTAEKAVLSDLPHKKYDIVFANIVANVIIDIHKLLPYYLKADGYLITSGIIRDREQDVMAVYGEDFKLIEKKYDGEWVAMVFKWAGSL